MTRVDEFWKAQLILTAWRYGNKYGGYQPTLMIAQVYANRRSRGWGAWQEILANEHKHSYLLQPPTGFPDTYDRAFIKVLSEIDPIYEGSAKDMTNGAVYFADTTNVTNPWFLENICRSGLHERVADNCTLTFWN